jgi:cob(I)alamin adenosyltransferase
MQLNLLNGTFDQREALDIIAQLMQVQIKFQENKINHSLNEEDIKFLENCIKKLHREWAEMRELIRGNGNSCNLESVIEVA